MDPQAWDARYAADELVWSAKPNVFVAEVAGEPDGSLLVVGHAQPNLAGGIGGPQDLAILYEPEDVAAWRADLDVVRSELAVRHVDSGDGARQALDTLVLARSGDAPGRQSP